VENAYLDYKRNCFSFSLSEFTVKENSIMKDASKKAGNISKKRGCPDGHPLYEKYKLLTN